MTQGRTLGTFLDRYTFRYERDYSHPPERIWAALTRAEHWDAWLMPKNRIEANLGGRFAFGFGGEPGTEWDGTITEYTPPEVVDFAYDFGAHMRFELQPIEGGTRLYFIHSFPPDFRHEDDGSRVAGGDLPGGPDTPWRPGFMAGFMTGLINLDSYVEGRGPTVEDQWEMVKRVHSGDFGPEGVQLTDEYRKLVRDTIPGGVKEMGA